MRTSVQLAALSIAGLLAMAGCGRTSSEPARSANIHRAPSVALPETTPNTAVREPKRGDIYDTQKGFEDELPPPDARGGGPANDSDVGAPRWRNNPGSYDDRTDTGGARGRIRPSAPRPTTETETETEEGGP